MDYLNTKIGRNPIFIAYYPLLMKKYYSYIKFMPEGQKFIIYILSTKQHVIYKLNYFSVFEKLPLFRLSYINTWDGINVPVEKLYIYLTPILNAVLLLLLMPLEIMVFWKSIIQYYFSLILMENPAIKEVVYKMGVPLIKFPVSFRKKSITDPQYNFI